MKFISSSNRSLTVAIVLVFVSVIFLNAGQAAASAISDFNLIALGDLNGGGTDVAGRTVVVGNISGDTKDFAVDTEAVSDPVDTQGLNQTDGLIVGGQIQTTVHVDNGGVRIGGSGTGSEILNADYVNDNDGSVSELLANVVLDVESYTTMLRGLTADDDSTVVVQDMNNAFFVSDPGQDNIALFDIDAALFSSGNYNLTIQGDLDADLIVIRVSGSDSITIGNNIHINGAFLDEEIMSKIVWFFDDATEVYIDTAMYGSVIAANADVTVGSGAGDGMHGTLVGQDITLYAQVHLPTLDTPTNPVPEPGTLLLFGTGTFFVGLYRRRRSKRSRA